MTNCIQCGTPTDSCCSNCESAFYCSASCQRAHWPTHKQQCHKPEEPVHVKALNAFKTAVLKKFHTVPKAIQSQPTFNQLEFKRLLGQYGTHIAAQRASEYFAALDLTGNFEIETSKLLIKPPVTQTEPSIDRKSAILAFRAGNYDESSRRAQQAVNSLNEIEAVVEFLLLAKILLIEEEPQKAKYYIRKVLENLEISSMLDSRGADVTSSFLLHTATIAEQLEFFYEAKGLFEQYLIIARRYFGENSLGTADAYTQCAGYFFRQGEYSAMLTNTERAKQIREMQLSGPHARRADAQANHALALQLNGKKSEARHFYRIALDMRETVFGAENLQVADVQFALGQIEEDPDVALSLFKRCFETRRSIIGAGHEQTLQAMEKYNQKKAEMISFNKRYPGRPLMNSSRSPVVEEEASYEEAVTKVDRQLFLPRVTLSNGNLNPRFSELLRSNGRAPVDVENGKIVSDAVVFLLDENTGKKIQDEKGYPVQVLNPLILSPIRGLSPVDIYGICRVEGGVELINADGSSLATMRDIQIEEEHRKMGHEVRSPRQASNKRTLFDSELLEQIRHADPKLFSDLEIEPTEIIAGLPRDLRNSVNRFKVHIACLLRLQELPLEKRSASIKRSLEGCLRAEKFHKVLKALAKVATALKKSEFTIGFNGIMSLLEVRGSEFSLADFFVDTLKKQKPELLDFNQELLSFLQTLGDLKETAIQLKLARRFVEVYDEISRLKFVFDELSESDSVRAKKSFIFDVVGITAEKTRKNLEKVKLYFSDVCEAFSIAHGTAENDEASEIQEFLINVNIFVEKIKI
jgi:MYND finger